MALRRGLGKGVDSLIPTAEDRKAAKKPAADKPKEKPEVQVVEKEVVKEVVKEVKVPADTTLPVSSIEPNRNQPRKHFDKAELEELTDSIKRYGVIQPLVVQKKNDYYEIIAGERRWRAAKLAKLKEVPVVIKDYEPQEASEIALIENLQRSDLNPIEEAKAYKNLIEEYDLRQEDVATRLSKSRSAITNSMRLLNLSDEVQAMIEAGELQMGHARALLGLENEGLQEKTAKTVVDKGLSVRETEKLVKNILHPKQKKLPIPNQNTAEVQRLSERLKEIFGTKVSINQKANGKGKIEIDYYSTEEFERLYEMFESIK
ncbi:MAG: ParB/RepB/Spo0J family partition protein [Eubacterium sp.]|nr:ParB/RepB/Spo0J family partition protein [Eubacterium sp.]